MHRAVTGRGTLVRTAAVRVLERSGDEPERAGALRQLVDLGYPVVLAEQAAFVARGVPAADDHDRRRSSAASLSATPSSGSPSRPRRDGCRSSEARPTR